MKRMDVKRHLARLYRRIPLPSRLKVWLIHRITPSFLVGVADVVLDKRGQILLLEHVFHRYYVWGLPGGWMDRGESPAQALRRELREEVGLEVEIESLLAIEPTNGSRGSQLQFGYLCRAVGEPTHLSYEILSARWVAPTPADLPGPVPPFHLTLIERMERGQP